jgi:hypothetical protein
LLAGLGHIFVRIVDACQETPIFFALDKFFDG